MRHVEALTSVPDDALETVVDDYKSEGATVTRVLQDDGKWTVVAMFFGKGGAAEDSVEPTVAFGPDGPPGTGRA
jgi:hypothetical protein